MDPDRWRRIEALFEEATALPASERAAFLSGACAGDPPARREVESLLAADEKAAGILGRAPAPSPPESLIGCRVGSYVVTSKLGEGGMGTVYSATRADDAFHQEVAIKVLRSGASRTDLPARFRAERQILASLQHPAIARLLDGGALDDGRPYLVMERIEGVPLDRYCDDRRLGLDERVDLFRKVCDAVQYAHRNLVVHRDIKPSNILVGDDGMPRLLDFGIAKLLAGAALPGVFDATMTGQRLMTPQYASPEQVEGGAVTTATDIYSLGVLLYLLLTGHLPYRLSRDTPEALERAVLDQEAERPSTAIRRAGTGTGPSGGVVPDGPTLEALCAARGLRPRQLRRRLRGDLDNIVLTALRKEPERRYASAGHMSEDLRRYREKLPVAAQPDSLRYRTLKFVGRHKAGVAGSLASLVVVVGLAVGMTVQAVRLARQKDEIAAERDKAVELAGVLEHLFASSDPSEARGEALTAREILDRGAEKAIDELAGQPDTQGALALVIGRVYLGLGLPDRAGPLLAKALALREQVHGASHGSVAESLVALAVLDQDRAEFASAEERLRRAIRILQTLGQEDERLADARNGLGATLIALARYAEAESEIRQALAIHRRVHGAENAAVASDLANLGSVLRKMGRLADAESVHREALAIGRKVFGPVHPKLARQVNNLAVVLVDQGRLPDAESLAREALSITRRLHPADHPDTALQLANLGSILQARGDDSGALAAAREGLQMRRRIFGAEHEQVAMSLGTLGDVLQQVGDPEGARASLEESLCIQRKVYPQEHPRKATTLDQLSSLALAHGDVESAERLAREALQMRERTLGPGHADFGSSLLTLGSTRAEITADEEAEDLLRRGLAILKAALPEGHWRVADAESRLGACLSVRGRKAEASPFLEHGYEGLLRMRGGQHPRTAAALQRILRHQGGVDALAAPPPATASDRSGDGSSR